MTADQWWQRIAEFTVAGDWNGVLVAADGLQELGFEEEAEGLRWLIRNQQYPILTENDYWSFAADFGMGYKTHLSTAYNIYYSVIGSWKSAVVTVVSVRKRMAQ